MEYPIYWSTAKDREWLKNEALAAVLEKLFCTLGNGHNWWRPLLWPLLCPFKQSTVFLRSNHASAQDSGVSDFTQNVLLNVSLFNSWPMIQVLRWDIHRLLKKLHLNAYYYFTNKALSLICLENKILSDCDFLRNSSSNIPPMISPSDESFISSHRHGFISKSSARSKPNIGSMANTNVQNRRQLWPNQQSPIS